MGESLIAGKVVRHSIVPEMASQLGLGDHPQFLGLQGPTALQPFLESFQL